MSRFKQIVFLLLGSLLPASLPAAGGAHWQQGEVLSRKTIAPGHHNNRTRYVYCIKGGSMQYTVRFDEPLSIALYSPLTFAVSGKHLFVQNPDGSELKAAIMQQSEPTIRH